MTQTSAAALGQPSTSDSRRAARDRKDLLALQMLAPLSSSYVPWTASSMRPSGVVAVLNEILVNRRRCVVELGCGVSTLFIGRLLRRQGGNLWTVEHDERWADLLARELTREDLDSVVTVVRAPLATVTIGWPDRAASWYAPDPLTRLIPDRDVDLLLVDGPPAHQAGREHARYPAVPFFAPRLADDYSIVLDDIHRAGEQDIMARWEGQLGITFERRLIDGGIGIGRPRPAYTI